jgi:hypothetical protein
MVVEVEGPITLLVVAPANMAAAGIRVVAAISGLLVRAGSLFSEIPVAPVGPDNMAELVEVIAGRIPVILPGK